MTHHPITSPTRPGRRRRLRRPRPRPCPRPLLVAVVGLLSVALVTGACSKETGSEQEFCQQVTKVPTIDILIAGYADADPAELDTRLDAASEAYAKLRNAAPGEIRDSVATVVDLVDAVITAVRDHPDDPEAVADGVRDAVQATPEAAKATRDVSSYASGHCGVELNPTVGDDPAPGTTARGDEPAGG